MPTFYNFRENGLDYSFDDIFVPADWFRDGNLWTWGNNTRGQLGNASTVNRSTPVTTSFGGTNWKQVSSGITHTAAIKTDGTLWTWGYGASGRLGNGATTGNISTPITTFLGGNNWKQVSADSAHTAAIKTDGTLWTWGSSSFGQLGNATVSAERSTPVTTFAGGTNWKQVNTGSSYTVAIKTDGTLWTWGTGTSGQLGTASTTDKSTPVTTFLGGNNWYEVSGSSASTAAIKTDGTLWTWGAGGSGQLGTASTTDKSTPVTTFLGGTNWKQVSAGSITNFGSLALSAIKTDGTLWTWGNGSTGQLGNAATTDRSTPVTTFLGGNNWKQVSNGNTYTVAIKTNGTLWVWGNGGGGRLGNGATTGTISTPITTFLGGNNWRQVIGRDAHTAALTYIDPVI